MRLTRSDFRRDDQGQVLSFYRPKAKSRHVIRLSEQTHRKIRRAIDAYHKAAELKGKDREHIFRSAQNRRAGLETYVHHTKLTARSLQRIVNAWGLTDGRGKLLAPHALRHHVGCNVSRKKRISFAHRNCSGTRIRKQLQNFTRTHQSRHLRFNLWRRRSQRKKRSKTPWRFRSRSGLIYARR